MKNNMLHAQQRAYFVFKQINPKNRQKNPFPKNKPKKLKCLVTFFMLSSYKMNINPKIL